MFNTPIVIVGNVLTAPDWRKTHTTGALVTSFRVASTSRRFDRENERWVDGDTLRVRVSCWRRLAENVGASVAVGDPIVVVGKLYTRDWIDEENNKRTSYEVEAWAIGHDLARGRTRLYRNRALAVSDAADAPESLVRGEPSDPVGEAPVIYGEGVPDDLEPPAFDEHRAPGHLATLAGGGFEPFDTTAGSSADADAGADAEGGADDVEALAIEVEAVKPGDADAGTAPRRGRRTTEREPVPA